MGRGRPPKPKSQKRSERLQTTVTQAELRQFSQAAKRDDRPLSDWARQKLKEAIGDGPVDYEPQD